MLLRAGIMHRRLTFLRIDEKKKIFNPFAFDIVRFIRQFYFRKKFLILVDNERVYRNFGGF